LAAVSPEIPIVYTPRFREFGIQVLDGGTSTILITHCPWCASVLPASLRDKWFDELARIGVDPYAGSIPEEFLDDRWYASA
jgi:hypothetical protein